MLNNLQTMPWVMPSFRPDGQAFVDRIRAGLGMPPREALE
jgi:hypothetical protein